MNHISVECYKCHAIPHGNPITDKDYYKGQLNNALDKREWYRLAATHKIRRPERFICCACKRRQGELDAIARDYDRIFDMMMMPNPRPRIYRN